MMGRLYHYEDAGLSLHHSIHQVQAMRGFMDMHAHDDFELFFFLQGDCSYLVEGVTYQLSPGSILLMRPAEAHCLCVNSDCTYERIVLNFSRSFLDKADPQGLLLEPFLDRALGEWNLYAAHDYGGSVAALLLNMVDAEFPRSDYEKQLAITTNLLPVLSELRRSFQQKKASSLSSKLEHHELLNYINRHLSDDLSLETLSNIFFLSKSQISRRFKQQTGTTLSNYVSAKRLIKARELLLAGIPAQQVSAECGFREYSTFYRAYQKKYGVSPVRSFKAQI